MRATPLVQLDEVLIERSRGVTLITANERLRRALTDAFIDSRSECPPILVIDDYLRTRFAELTRQGNSRELLSPSAQRLAWLECAPEIDEIEPEQLYSDVADAWRTMHDWSLADRLSEFDDNENHRLFREWAQRYNSAAKARWITYPELASCVADAIRRRVIPADPLLMMGFDVVPASVDRLIDAVRSTSKDVDVLHPTRRTAPNIVYWDFDDSTDELNAAIRWAGERIEPVGATAAIVVPDAVANHDSIVGRLDALLNPADPFTTPTSDRFNVSGGVALDSVPVVADALELLEWLVAPVPFNAVERLLRSPFFRFGVDDAHTGIESLPESYSAARWARGRLQSPLLEVVKASRRSGLLRLDHALVHMRDLLARVGWPRADRLRSESLQATSAFAALLDELGRCTQFVAPGGLPAMIRLVRRAAMRQLFAPARPNARLQVLGSLETVGLSFTHLWVTGLDELSWPAAPRPNPFVPLRLQRAAGVARCDVGAEAAFARRMTEHWMGSAQTVVFSRALSRNDESVRASWLVSSIRGDSIRQPSNGNVARGHPHLRGSPAVSMVDRVEPPVGRVDVGRLRHRGTAILRDQSACPFRSFARNRLYVESRRRPHSYPDAAQRGTAAHVAMRVLFERLGPDVNLARVFEVDRADAIRHSVDAAVTIMGHMPAAFRESERARLHQLLDEWLQVELARPPFRIVGLERATSLLLGEMEFDLQIDRVDRDGDDVLVFDYKTGDVSSNSVFGERPEEPQLPMYAVATPGSTAIAFGELLAGACRAIGWARQPHSSGSIRLRVPTEERGEWQRMKHVWHRRLVDLSDEFARGTADVRPRNAKACQECDLHALCRIREMDRIESD